MATAWVNGENMLGSLKAQMNAEMMAAAEPAIKKALEEAEKEMRKRLAAMFVALIDRDFNFERNGHDLRIIVRHAAYEKEATSL